MKPQASVVGVEAGEEKIGKTQGVAAGKNHE